jgi:hypothetical protein
LIQLASLTFVAFVFGFVLGMLSAFLICKRFGHWQKLKKFQEPAEQDRDPADWWKRRQEEP